MWIPDDTPVLETVFSDLAPNAIDISGIIHYGGVNTALGRTAIPADTQQPVEAVEHRLPPLSCG
jgi:hypothetical protein